MPKNLFFLYSDSFFMLVGTLDEILFLGLNYNKILFELIIRIFKAFLKYIYVHSPPIKIKIELRKTNKRNSFLNIIDFFQE